VEHIFPEGEKIFPRGKPEGEQGK